MAPISLRPSTLDSNLQKLGGPTPRNVLTVCGDAMRCSHKPESARTEETDRALLALSVEDVVTGLKSVTVGEVGAAVARAANESFEAAFADDDGERGLFADSAVTALRQRDAMQSMLVAARRRAELAQEHAGAKGKEGKETLLDVVGDVERALTEQVDRKKHATSRTLTGINPERRKALLALDAGEREAAWWFSNLAEEANDGLLARLGDLGDKANEARPAFDVASALRRVSLGVAAPREVELLEARAKSDPALAEALGLARSVDVDAVVDA